MIEDKIYAEKEFFTELQKIMDKRFNKLVKKLKLTDEMDNDILFEYLYNGPADDLPDEIYEAIEKKRAATKCNCSK